MYFEQFVLGHNTRVLIKFVKMLYWVKVEASNLIKNQTILTLKFDEDSIAMQREINFLRYYFLNHVLIFK